MAYAEIEITAEVLWELLCDQHPDLTDRPLTLDARGWGNQPCRLGDDPAVREDTATATDCAGPALLLHGDVEADADYPCHPPGRDWKARPALGHRDEKLGERTAGEALGPDRRVELRQ
ncbi:hypothetical protein [Streptomyces sp. LN325]|uniref:hypothetical protein n=1 Tax=Streptomyces sp. LN325 TaxID=3112976 RepID=UPI00370FF67D